MLTEEQRIIFREILDLNWEFSHTEDNWSVKWDIARKLNQRKKDLKMSMGEEAYDRFMNMGREMFSPRKEMAEEIS